jgi:hypothetical protein
VTRARAILFLDGGGALLAAAIMFGFRDALSSLHGFTPALVSTLATVNALYGCYSTSLAVQAAPSRRAVEFLIAANLAWMISCVSLVLLTWKAATVSGSLHVGLEGFWVAALAWAEWKWVRSPFGQKHQSPAV